MKPFVYRIMFVLSLLTLGVFSSQATTLGLGDIAFTGYNSDAASSAEGDDFSFVLLKDVDAGTTITFTDRGWLSSGGFRTATEGILTITLPASSCGDEFRLINNPSTSTTWIMYGDAGTNIGSFTSSGTGSGFILDSTGDQLFAYQGLAPTSGNQTGFISAIQTHGSWDANATDSFTSALPSIFSSNPGNDFAIGTNQDNGKYQCSITIGLPANIRAAIYNVSNWQFSNSSASRFPLLSYCNFTCQSACTAPVITSLTTNSTIGSNTFCPGDAVVITVNGSANDATNWNLYSGSCGGAVVNTIPVSNNTFSFTATNTITLYVGGTGGCVTTPTCTPITITVNGLTANAGSDQKISGSTTANISGNGSGTWSIVGVGDGNGLFAGNTTTSTTPTTTFSGTAGQQYTLRWTVANAGCSASSDDVVITFLSPTTLGLGDIAFTGVNTDNPDQYTFVLLKDINAGTQITFDENGWLSTDGFRVGENAITFELCRPYACGDEFKVEGTAITDDNAVSAGTVMSGSALTLAVGGDQIFAYQGTAPTTGNAANWIAAINTNGPWLTTGTVGTLESYKPSAFTDGTNSISFASTAQNAKYGCTITTNSPANLAATINNNSNWSTSSNPINLNFCSFTCGSCAEPALTSVTAPATACLGQTVTLTINGTLNGANEWAIYTGSCGGTLVGTTTSSSFNVTPTATTTYYVSGRGGCVVTESCQTATIAFTAVQADAGPDQKLNGASFTTLQANGGFGDGTWTFSNNGEKDGDGQGSFSDDENPSAIFSGTAGQAYTLKWTLNNSAAGCPDTEDEVTIVFLDQTGLTLGDIAFTSYSADNDNISFILLKDITAGTSIKFTDRGWLAAGGFRGGESTMTVEFCRPYSCGDEFDIFDALQEIKDASGVIAGTVSGEINPATSGDQIFAYQGPETNLITGIQMNGPWDADATSAETSAKPAAFTDGVNSISFPTEFDNAYLDCSKVTTASASQIYTTSNWILSDNVSAPLPLNCNLSCCTPGVATSINGYVGPPLCPSSTQTLSVNGSLNDDQEWVWYTGSCGGTEIKRGGASINVSPNVTTTYYVRAEGTCSGTSGTCVSFQVEIEDKVDPEVTCPANITVNNDPGECSAVVNFSASGTDNCSGTVAIIYSQNPGTAFDVGTTPVIVTALDDAGNPDDCSFTITVNDNEDPGVTFCPGNIDVNAEPGKCGATITWQTPTFDDNCAIVLVPTTHNSGDFFPVTPFSPTIVTYTAFDASFKSITCSFSVIVRDFELPVFSDCPGNISVDNDTGDCGAIVNWTPPTLSDNCTGASSSSTHDPGHFFDVGTTTVTYSGEDTAFNPAVDCSFTVTVNDAEAPKFSNCPGTINVFNDAGDCGALVSWTPPGFTDNCPDATFESSHDPGDFFEVGTTTVTYSGSDAADNDAIDCSFTVSVNDAEKPVIACPANIATGTDPGECGADVSFTPAFANDNCAIKEVKARYQPVDENNSSIGSWTSRVVDPSGFFPVGRYQVQWRAEDIYGNKKTCSHYLDVYDNEDPVAVCKDVTVDFNGEEDINLSVSQVWNEAASSDNCGSVSYVGTSPGLSIDCDDLGNTVALTVTIEDEAGNKDQCTSYVSVIGLPCGWAEGPQDGSLNCGNDTSSDYDVDDESFTLTADGCWHDCLESDKAAFVYHELCGDGQLTVRLADINTSGYAGLMARESLDPDARRAGVLKNYSTRRVRREWRAAYGGVVSQRPSNRSRVEWLRIVRQGNSIKSYTSTNGSSWRLLYQVTFPSLEDCIYFGMTAYSLNGSAEVEAVFDNVSISSSGSLAGGFGDETTAPGQFLAYDIAGNIGEGEVNIFPNPASHETQIVLNGFEDKPAQIVIRDQLGRLVRRIDVDSAMGLSETIPVHDLAAGIYLVSIIQDQQATVSKKLVIQQ